MPSASMTEVIARLRADHAEAPPAAPTLAELRESFSPAGEYHPVPADVEITDVDAGGVPAHWFRTPGADPTRAVLFLHGGGYTLGSATSHGELIARLARASGLPVLALDYRLAPEHPYPAALEDAHIAWRWLRAGHGLDAASIAVAGDSAGGGLALALLIALRDAGEQSAAAAVLMSPWTDLTLSGPSISQRRAEDPLLTPELLGHLAAGYLRDTDAKDPHVSPLFADLTGLPPLLIQVGTAEILLSDSERLALAAAHVGVDVSLHVVNGAPHVFQSMLGTPEADAALSEIGLFLTHRMSSRTAHLAP